MKNNVLKFISFIDFNVTGTPKRIPILKKGASDENFLDTDDEFFDQNSAIPSPGPLSKAEFKVAFSKYFAVC